MSAASIAWAAPPPDLTLPSGDVHVWRISLAAPESTVTRLLDVLSADEADRAARFRADADRRRFVVAHAAVRSILAACLGTDPRELNFARSAGGKPFLAGPTAPTDVRFNLSHSHDLALLAVSWGREVGVDLEWLPAVRDIDGIAARYFSPLERQALERMAPDQRRAAFLRGWVLKEAYLKACGDGLTRRLDDFDVAIGAEEPAGLLEVRDRPGDETRWTLHDLQPHPEFVAALVVEGSRCRLQRWAWT